MASLTAEQGIQQKTVLSPFSHNESLISRFVATISANAIKAQHPTPRKGAAKNMYPTQGSLPILSAALQRAKQGQKYVTQQTSQSLQHPQTGSIANLLSDIF
eukprot:CAMPEP_0194332112 /NCGR_PEP_ID=MMETSP0171-20130528/58069_1 /TAXON_ID=218684 /ORGANISM="Corethron pennatum, Strain L29A3" /LENGTH=101 /DNA_ID=CAMNT_0039093829 /DNA_START=91 /DNA_END=396 /DNA_ORIENTATION=+